MASAPRRPVRLPVRLVGQMQSMRRRDVRSHRGKREIIELMGAGNMDYGPGVKSLGG